MYKKFLLQPWLLLCYIFFTSEIVYIIVIKCYRDTIMHLNMVIIVVLFYFSVILNSLSCIIQKLVIVFVKNLPYWMIFKLKMCLTCARYRILYIFFYHIYVDNANELFSLIIINSLCYKLMFFYVYLCIWYIYPFFFNM